MCICVYIYIYILYFTDTGTARLVTRPQNTQTGAKREHTATCIP